MDVDPVLLMDLSSIVRTSFHTTDQSGRPVTLSGRQVVELLFMIKAIDSVPPQPAAPEGFVQDVTWGHGPAPVVTRRATAAATPPSQGPQTTAAAALTTAPKTTAAAPDVKREPMPSPPKAPPVVNGRAIVCYTCGEQGHHRNRCDIYKTEMCWHHSIGKCLYGTKCYKAHSDKEFREFCCPCDVTHAKDAHLSHAY